MSKYIKKFETEAQYTAAESGLILPNVSLVTENNTVHYNPYDPCASEKVKTTYEWVEIGGVKWATKNVGALTVTDYGQKFSWGGTKGYTHDQVSGTCKSFSWDDYELGNGTSSPDETGMTKYNSTDGKTVLEAEDDAATVNMGSGWRMPTKDEYVALGKAVNTAWTSDYKSTGIAGMVCTAKNGSGAELFFPAAGNCDNGSVFRVGSHGNYWSSSLYAYKIHAYDLGFNSGGVNWQGGNIRYVGQSVRGVVDE